MESTALSEPPLPLATIEAQLEKIIQAAAGISLFEFVGPSALMPEPRPGAHIDVHLPGQLIRQYSLVTPLCSPGHYVVAVKREPTGRGGSRYLHDEARQGSCCRIGLPRNNFELDESCDRNLLLAGGIGITPLYGMFMRLRELKRQVEMHYWSSTPDRALFRTELTQSPLATLHYPTHAGRPKIADIVKRASPGTRVYCCGPARMIEEAIASVAQPSQLRIERFSAAEPGAGDCPVSAFTVHLSRQKRDIVVESGQTILGALTEAGIDVAYSCEEGVCGACETRMLSGDPLHRDSIRSPDEHARRGTIMICCSLSRSSRMVLDL
jgi:vanillate O-demethylase ferredoxin subunit